MMMMMKIFIPLIAFSIFKHTSTTKYIVPGFVQVYTVQYVPIAVSGNFTFGFNRSGIGCRASDKSFIVQSESKCKQLTEMS